MDQLQKKQKLSHQYPPPRLPIQLPPNVSALTPAAYNSTLDVVLSAFWEREKVAMRALVLEGEQEFKNDNDLPLARIKRIMKSDEDVRMISAEAPIVFAKACELFILELTIRSFSASERLGGRGCTSADVAAAISSTDTYDFLEGVLEEERKLKEAEEEGKKKVDEAKKAKPRKKRR